MAVTAKKIIHTAAATLAMIALIAGCGGKSTLNNTQAAEAGLAGTPDIRWYSAKPKAKIYTISTADELAGLAQIVNGTSWRKKLAKHNFSGKTVKLAANIDLFAYKNWTPIGAWDPAANASIPFSGIFDGGGYVISNLTINRPDAKDQGLFGYIERGTVQNLGLEGANVHGSASVGIIAGVVWSNSSIVNCYSIGTVNAAVSYAGGIAGVVVDSSSISNCYSAAAVRSGDHAGGIAGRIGSNSSIINNFALNPEVSATDMSAKVGRVVGSIAEAQLGPVTLSNNAAWDEMKDADGNAAWPRRTKDAQDGADITAEKINTDGTLDGRFRAGSGWTTESGKLPGMGGRAAEMPGHLR